MRLPDRASRGTIRLSLSRLTTDTEIETAIEALAEAVGRIRSRAGSPTSRR